MLEFSHWRLPMKLRVFPLAVLVALLAHAAPAVAQDKGQFGLSMGFPVSLGVIWHVSDSIAIRPEFTFTTTSTETETGPIDSRQPVTITTDSDASTVGAAIGALFYVAKWDNIRAYVSPRFQFQHGSGTTTISGSSIIGAPPPPTETDS